MKTIQFQNHNAYDNLQQYTYGQAAVEFVGGSSIWAACSEMIRLNSTQADKILALLSCKIYGLSFITLSLKTTVLQLKQSHNVKFKNEFALILKFHSKSVKPS